MVKDEITLCNTSDVVVHLRLYLFLSLSMDQMTLFLNIFFYNCI